MGTSPGIHDPERNYFRSRQSRNEPYAQQFTFIEPDYGDFLGPYTGGTSQHPLDSITGGERLMKDVYETVRNSPLWESSALIVTWDEHGGFYDHVIPPAAPPRSEPRQDAPRTLPDPVDQPLAGNQHTPDSDGPVHGANLPGFLGAALRSHLVLAADHERDSIDELVAADSSSG